MENHHVEWEIHYKWQFSIAMLNYQRVTNLANELGHHLVDEGPRSHEKRGWEAMRMAARISNNKRLGWRAKAQRGYLCNCWGAHRTAIIQWIGLRENHQETMVFSLRYGGFRLKFSLKPIHWIIWMSYVYYESNIPKIVIVNLYIYIFIIWTHKWKWTCFLMADWTFGYIQSNGTNLETQKSEMLAHVSNFFYRVQILSKSGGWFLFQWGQPAVIAASIPNLKLGHTQP